MPPSIQFVIHLTTVDFYRIFRFVKLIDSNHLICCLSLPFHLNSNVEIFSARITVDFFFPPSPSSPPLSLSSSSYSDTIQTIQENQPMYQVPHAMCNDDWTSFKNRINSEKKKHPFIQSYFNILPFSCNSRYLKCCHSFVNK